MLVQEGKAGYVMDCKITLIPGDGIGPEIVAEAVKVLNAVADKYVRLYEDFNGRLLY